MPASQANSSSIRTGNFPRLPRSIPKATATAIEIGWPAVRAGWQFGQATPDRTAHDGSRKALFYRVFSFHKAFLGSGDRGGESRSTKSLRSTHFSTQVEIIERSTSSGVSDEVNRNLRNPCSGCFHDECLVVPFCANCQQGNDGIALDFRFDKTVDVLP